MRGEERTGQERRGEERRGEDFIVYCFKSVSVSIHIHLLI